VVMPSTPADAKGLMTAAIRDGNPVVFVEDRLLYNRQGVVPEGEHTVAIGSADVKRSGTDVTVVATSRMTQVALAAAELLATQGISVEVVDPRSLVPLDSETLVESVKRTSRAVVVDGGYRQYGITGEIAATIAEEAFDWLDAPVVRIGAEDVPIPFSKVLEPLVLPDPSRLASRVAKLVHGN
jgi:pyruvate/2-oxoglutarate/acetoin dehydrogenase E1 component